jgi:hypothetical protein
MTATLTGPGLADVEASVTALDFGAFVIGASSGKQTFTNYTNGAISLTRIAIRGDVGAHL